MIIIDQNLSPKLCRGLMSIFPGLVHVFDIGLDNQPDQAIWEYAKEKAFHILTQDVDFKNIQLRQGFPPKIIWLRSGNLRSKQVIETLSALRNEIGYFLNDDSIGILEIF